MLMQYVQVRECWENAGADAVCAGVGVVGEH